MMGREILGLDLILHRQFVNNNYLILASFQAAMVRERNLYNLS